MKLLATVFLLILFAGCATSSESEISNAVSDYIKVAELEEQDSIRTMGDYRHRIISQRYVTVEANTENYLVEFTRRCHELTQQMITPDIRYEKNILRSRFDTIRGCRIGRIYAIDKGQAEELRNLGEAPGN
ncbi:MAG: DUF6491 family protein [Woeseiaceae bacterium]